MTDDNQPTYYHDLLKNAYQKQFDTLAEKIFGSITHFDNVQKTCN